MSVNILAPDRGFVSGILVQNAMLQRVGSRLAVMGSVTLEGARDVFRALGRPLEPSDPSDIDT